MPGRDAKTVILSKCTCFLPEQPPDVKQFNYGHGFEGNMGEENSNDQFGESGYDQNTYQQQGYWSAGCDGTTGEGDENYDQISPDRSGFRPKMDRQPQGNYGFQASPPSHTMPDLSGLGKSVCSISLARICCTGRVWIARYVGRVSCYSYK